MNELQTYETLIRQKSTGRALLPRIFLILVYLVWVTLWLALLLRFHFRIPLVLLGPLTTLPLILITWKYVQVEYEYTIGGGTFFLAKVYGKKKRKPLLEAELKSALLIAPRTEEFMEKAERMGVDEVIWAVSSPESERIWMLLYEEEESKERILLFFEGEERSIRLLRHYNPRATARLF